MKHIEKIEKEFDEKFVITHKMQQCIQPEVKSFLRSSHTSFVQDLIQRVEGEKVSYDDPKIFDPERIAGMNSALDTIIKMLKEEI